MLEIPIFMVPQFWEQLLFKVVDECFEISLDILSMKTVLEYLIPRNALTCVTCVCCTNYKCPNTNTIIYACMWQLDGTQL